MRLTPFGTAILLIIAVAIAARLTGMKADASANATAPAAISLPQ